MFADPRTKPPAGALVDWSHPLTRDLTFACLFLESTGRAIDTVTGTVSTAVPGTWQGGPLGPAVRFNGTSSVADFGHNAAWNPASTGDFTMGVYANPTASASLRGMLTKRTSSGPQISMFANMDANGNLSSGSWGALAIVGTSVRIAASTVGMDGLWRLYSASLRSGVFSLYLDGLPISITTLSQGGVPVYANTDPMRVGSAANNNFFDRSISHALFWRRSLTADEHARLAAEPFAMFSRSRPELFAALTSFRAGWLARTPVLGSGVY